MKSGAALCLNPGPSLSQPCDPADVALPLHTSVSLSVKRANERTHPITQLGTLNVPEHIQWLEQHLAQRDYYYYFPKEGHRKMASEGQD